MSTIQSDRGAAAVEFALVLPLLVFVLFGIIEFGFLLCDKAIITNASREAARRASVYNRSPVADIKNAIADEYGALPIQVPSAPFTAADVDIQLNNPAGYVTATVRYNYNFFIVPDLEILFAAESPPDTVSLTATTVMRME